MITDAALDLAGLPLISGKACSLFTLQGVTAGDTKPIQRIILHWSTKAEGRWPGSLYVGLSRASEVHNIALAKPLTVSDLSKIGTYETWKKQDALVSKLQQKALEFRESKKSEKSKPWHGDDDKYWGSPYDFAQRLFWFCEVVGERLLQSSAPEATKEEARTCMAQWKKSLEELGYNPNFAGDFSVDRRLPPARDSEPQQPRNPPNDSTSRISSLSTSPSARSTSVPARRPQLAPRPGELQRPPFRSAEFKEYFEQELSRLRVPLEYWGVFDRSEISNADLRMRIVDYLHPETRGSEEARYLAAWAENLGFSVELSTKEQQGGASCGCVAAEAIVKQVIASRELGHEWDFMTVDTSDAVDSALYRSHYDWLLKRDVRGDIYFSPTYTHEGKLRRNLRHNENMTYYLSSSEVYYLMERLWNRFEYLHVSDMSLEAETAADISQLRFILHTEADLLDQGVRLALRGDLYVETHGSGFALEDKDVSFLSLSSHEELSRGVAIGKFWLVSLSIPGYF